MNLKKKTPSSRAAVLFGTVEYPPTVLNRDTQYAPFDIIRTAYYVLRISTTVRTTTERVSGEDRNVDPIMRSFVQGEASFTQRLFLHPGCHGNEFEAKFL